MPTLWPAFSRRGGEKRCCYASYPPAGLAQRCEARHGHAGTDIGGDITLREAGGRVRQQFERLHVLLKQLRVLSRHAGQASGSLSSMSGEMMSDTP